MLGNCEKMTLTSTNEWPQPREEEEEEEDRVLMAPLSGSNLMEKPSHDQAQRCPRCDSSNTKFCYYNNYSLSQPRHFCKACKRYWTRGGTLRNVPVGGGCRKNKRVKRPATSALSSADNQPLLLPPHNPTHQIVVSTTSSDINSLFYALPNNSTDMNPPFSRLSTCNGYDHQPQLGALGLNYSSGLQHKDYGAVFNSAQIEEAINPSTLFSNYSLFGSSSSPSSSLTATLMASTLQQQQQQQKLALGLNNTRPINDFQVFLPFQDLQLTGNANSEVFKGVKLEVDEEDDDYDDERNVMNNKMEWHFPCEIPINTAADSSLYWNPTAGAWPETTNFGSTTAPLI